MNTRGPSGGKGATKQVNAKHSAPTARTTSYSARAGKDRGDTAQIASRNLQGQKAMTSRIGVRKQAAVNKGPFTDFSVSGQNLGRTQVSAPTKYNRNSAQPRAIQNSMKGKGTPAG